MSSRLVPETEEASTDRRTATHSYMLGRALREIHNSVPASVSCLAAAHTSWVFVTFSPMVRVLETRSLSQIPTLKLLRKAPKGILGRMLVHRCRKIGSLSRTNFSTSRAPSGSLISVRSSYSSVMTLLSFLHPSET